MSQNSVKNRPSVRGATVPLNQLHWESGRQLLLGPDGEHTLPFSEDFPFLLECNEFAQAVHISPSHHNYLELIYFYRGSCLFHICEREYQCAQGDLLLVGDSELHHLETRPQRTSHAICLFYLPELIYQPGAQPADLDYLGPFLADGRETTRQLRRNRQRRRRGSPCGEQMRTCSSSTRRSDLCLA